MTRVLPVPRRGQQICLYGGENHVIIFSPRNNKIYVCTVARTMTSYSPPHDFRQQYRRKPTQFLTRGSPVVLDTRQIKPITHPQHEARHPPCCIRRRGRKGDPNREPPFLCSHSAGIVFPGSKGRSSAPTQVASHHES